jgi:SAM-dependent methyltransferase
MANESERERWNDERRYTVWPKRERLTDAVTALLMEALAPASGERVLDVGCGGGRSAFEVARIVGSGGSVVGWDLSEGLLALAEERLADSGAGNVTFVLGDAQVERLPGPPFDAAISQFGVMFFEDPVAAFANIRAHLRGGGRLVFACWQPLEANPWFFSEAVKPFVPPPPPREPGAVVPGPFAFGDAGHVTSVLEGAGFVDVEAELHGLSPEAPLDTVLDELQLTAMGVPEEDLDEAMDAATAYMERFRVDGGLWRFPIAFQIFSATTP